MPTLLIRKGASFVKAAKVPLALERIGHLPGTLMLNPGSSGDFIMAKAKSAKVEVSQGRDKLELYVFRQRDVNVALLSRDHGERVRGIPLGACCWRQVRPAPDGDSQLKGITADKKIFLSVVLLVVMSNPSKFYQIRHNR